MAHDVFNDASSRDVCGLMKPSQEHAVGVKREHSRTKEDFMQFCAYVLEYTNFVPENTNEDVLSRSGNGSLDSSGTRGAASDLPSSPENNPPKAADKATDEDYHLITCFCNKPYASRPMIECCECLVWIHLSCAKIRLNNIPTDFVCQKCREAKVTVRKSQRMRTESKRLKVESN